VTDGAVEKFFRLYSKGDLVVLSSVFRVIARNPPSILFVGSIFLFLLFATTGNDTLKTAAWYFLGIGFFLQILYLIRGYAKRQE